MAITTTDPTTGRDLATYDSHDDATIETLLATGHMATRQWGRTDSATRAATVRAIAQVLRKESDTLSHLITSEMGKPIGEARGELEKCAVTAEFYADHADDILADRHVEVGASVTAWISYEPIGLVYAVMPWNFPFWQAMRFALPALVAGNGVFLKHSPNVTGCALEIQRVCEEAGLPAGVFTSLVVEEERVPLVSDRLIADDRIAAVTLTGSNRAGEAVGAAAGRAVKKAVLELGGSDAFVVLADADIAAAAATAVRARFNNGGQSCVCAKRFIVDERVADEFTRLFVEGVEKLVVGDPVVLNTQVGPMARSDLRGALQDQVDRSVAAGAHVLTGGRAAEGTGFYYMPTVLGGVAPGMPVFDEETFGPVAAVAVARDDDHAIELANDSDFGLGLSVWSADRARAVGVAKRITSGAAFINAMVASDARVPFGGTKRSGHGRELSDLGLREFTNIRTYWSAD